MKETLILYKDWWEAIKSIPTNMQLEAYNSICAYAFEGVQPTDPMIAAVTALMRSAIDRDKAKWESVCEKRRASIKSRWDKQKAASASEQVNTTDTPNTTDTNVFNSIQKIQMNTSDTDNDNDNDNDNVNDNEIKEKNKKEICALSELEKQFEEFRKAYPGTKRGFKAEFDNFKRKNPKTWREIIPLLAPALERLIEWHERSIAAGQFTPNYKNLATWLNQQCWTEELPEIIVNPITPRNNVTNTINNGYTDRQSEFARHIIDKLTTPDRPEPDISGNY